MSRKPNDVDTSDRVSQSRRFEEAARALGCDEDPARFDEALKKVARHKPAKGGDKAEKPKDQGNAKSD